MKSKLKKLRSNQLFNSKYALMFAGVFAVIGVVTIAISFARIASNAKAAEGESASYQQNVAIVNDDSASSKSYLEFRSAPSGNGSSTGNTGALQTVYIVGDSLCVGSLDLISSGLDVRASGAVDTDCQGGRTMSGGISAVNNRGSINQTVIVELGTNGGNQSLFSSEVDQMISLLRQKGAEDIYFVTAFVNQSYQSDIDRNNAILANVASTNDDISVCDWRSVISKNLNYFTSDGVHYNQVGSQAFGEFIAGCPKESDGSNSTGGSTGGSTGESNEGTTSGDGGGTTTLRRIPDSEIPLYTTNGRIPESTNSFEPGQGNFRLVCEISHLDYDDPIVYPGQNNAAHLHMFWGNTLVDHNSTTNSLLGSGESTCGGPLNRSAYWAPALIDSRGNARIPAFISTYYKSNKNEAQFGNRPLPEGLRMITDEYTWKCGNQENDSKTIPNCSAGADLRAQISFPMCWNGRDLDSPNHRSHMAFIYYDNGRPTCPSTHPVKLPHVEYFIYWENPDLASNSNWYISSDRHNGMNHPGGSTMHADWWGAWQPTVMKRWVDECITATRNCIAGELGDGTILAGQKSWGGSSYVIPVPNMVSGFLEQLYSFNMQMRGDES